MLGTLLRILIVSAGLALYEIYLRDWYKTWLQLQGKAYGFGESILGYFCVLVGAYIISRLLVWKVERRRED